MTGVAERPPKEHVADMSRVDPVGRTREERHNLAAIDRRIAWIASHVGDYPSEAARDRARAEERALRWALCRIADAERYENTTGAAPS